MANLTERIEAEFENIERVLLELPARNSFDRLSNIELAGVGALLHNFYNGLENILKQIMVSSGTELATTASWHRDLVDTARAKGIISESTAERLKPYLGFRHFFSHGYSFDLDKERIIPLVKGIPGTFLAFRDDIEKTLTQN